ncbi:hypothetical protein PAPHI01_0412 [Pancytospora philotis]|nr:hypothetical protein PAPHI01_0412 [Pancytospora philotis]
MHFVVVVTSYALACLASSHWEFSEVAKKPYIVSKEEFERRLETYRTKLDAMRASSCSARAEITKKLRERLDPSVSPRIICSFLRDCGAIWEGGEHTLEEAKIDSFVALCLGDDSEAKSQDEVLRKLVKGLGELAWPPGLAVPGERLCIGRIIGLNEFVQIIHDAADQANKWLFSKINWEKVGGAAGPYMREVKLLDRLKLARFDAAARRRKYATGRDLEQLRRMFPAWLLAKDPEEGDAASLLLYLRPTFLSYGTGFYDHASFVADCARQFQWGMNSGLDGRLLNRMNYSTESARITESAFPVMHGKGLPVSCYIELKDKLNRALVQAGALDAGIVQTARNFDIALMKIVERIGERCCAEPRTRVKNFHPSGMNMEPKAQACVLEYFSVFAVKFDELVTVAVGGDCTCSGSLIGSVSAAGMLSAAGSYLETLTSKLARMHTHSHNIGRDVHASMRDAREKNVAVNRQEAGLLPTSQLVADINANLRRLLTQFVQRSIEVVGDFNAVVNEVALESEAYCRSGMSAAAEKLSGTYGDRLLSEVKDRSSVVVTDLDELCSLVNDAMVQMAACCAASRANSGVRIWLSNYLSCSGCSAELPLMYAYGIGGAGCYPHCPDGLREKLEEVLVGFKRKLERYESGLQARKGKVPERRAYFNSATGTNFDDSPLVCPVM